MLFFGFVTMWQTIAPVFASVVAARWTARILPSCLCLLCRWAGPGRIDLSHFVTINLSHFAYILNPRRHL